MKGPESEVSSATKKAVHLAKDNIQGPKKWFATKEGPRQEQAIFSGSVHAPKSPSICALGAQDHVLNLLNIVPAGKC